MRLLFPGTQKERCLAMYHGLTITFIMGVKTNKKQVILFRLILKSMHGNWLSLILQCHMLHSLDSNLYKEGRN